MTLENLLRDLNNYHKYHGITILFNEPKTAWIRIKDHWLKIATGILLALYILSSMKTFSDNNSMNRMINLILAFAVLEILLTAHLFWRNRQRSLELVDWCRQIETHQDNLFNKPNDWFLNSRERVQAIVRFFVYAFIGLFTLVTFVGPVIQTYFLGRYQLAVIFQFKNFSETNSYPVRFIEFIIFGSGSWFLLSIMQFSFSLFVLFTHYIVAQLELIKIYTAQLDLKNTLKLRYQLKVIVELHLDVIRVIQTLSKIFAMNIKAKEYALYLYVTAICFGRELKAIEVPLTAIGIIIMICCYCYGSEKMMEAENDIRDAYYELDWYTAPVLSRKLLILAMQEPQEIRIGRIFYSDHASMERFLTLIRGAYDFSLVLLKFAKQ